MHTIIQIAIYIHTHGRPCTVVYSSRYIHTSPTSFPGYDHCYINVHCHTGHLRKYIYIYIIIYYIIIIIYIYVLYYIFIHLSCTILISHQEGIHNIYII